MTNSVEERTENQQTENIVDGGEIVRAFLADVDYEPAGSYLFVVPFKEADLTTGGIVIPDQSREREFYGLVVHVGPGFTSRETGREVLPRRHAGEIVVYGKYGGTELPDMNGWQLLSLQDDVIWAFKRAENVRLVYHEAAKAIHAPEQRCELCQSVSGEERLERLRRLAAGDDLQQAPTLVITDAPPEG